METYKEITHLINKSIYLIAGVIVACFGGFWIHDCNKYPSPQGPPHQCESSAQIITSENEAKHCDNGAVLTTQVLDFDKSFDSHRKVLYTCNCVQPIVIKQQ